MKYEKYNIQIMILNEPHMCIWALNPYAVGV